MHTTLGCEEVALIIFDFAAAFPSRSQAFIRRTLEYIGLPPHALAFFEALYHDNKCAVSLAGAQHDGFSITAGIRQGCPLSPLIYVVAADSLLRLMAKRLATALIRGFADGRNSRLQVPARSRDRIAPGDPHQRSGGPRGTFQARSGRLSFRILFSRNSLTRIRPLARSC